MITFDGYTLRNYVDKINDIRRPVMARREHTMVDIPGRAGAFIARSKSGIKTIEVDVQVFGDTKAAIRSKVDALAAVLFTEEPAALVFDDEPSKTYYAVVAEDTPFEEMARIGRSTIKFLCPDPYATGAARSKTITNGVSTSVGGNVPTHPKFTVTFTTSKTSYEIKKTSGEKINVTASFASGSTLIIDCKENLITLNGTVNNQILSIDSDFFTIGPTNETFTLSTGANVTLAYNERWL